VNYWQDLAPFRFSVPLKLIPRAYQIFKVNMNMDEEEPPSLVDVDGNEEGSSLKEQKTIKVPITIVTGKFSEALTMD